MPKDANIVETSNANKVFDLPVSLQPGQVNTLSFPQDSISQMRELPKGELEISFRDGSKIVIENFDELVHSQQSCGRDTLIQLSDNTIIYPEELAAKLDKGPVSFETADTKGLVLLDEPKAGQIVEKNIQSGQEYKLNFALNDTISAAQAGQNLILTFKDGGVLVLKNYYTAMGSELPPAMTLADGSVIDSNALLTSCKLVEIPAIAETVQTAQGAQNGKVVTAIEPSAGEDQSGEQVASAARKGVTGKGNGDAPPNVEPAAGDEPTDVANIEPAAGDAGGAPASSSRGYGFGSSIDPALLNGANPVGPLGQTQLNYGANFLSPFLNPGLETRVDTVPVVLSGGETVDETNLGPIVVTGNANADFRENGPGVVTFNSNVVVGGSVAGGVLTSHGQPVTVTLSGNTYTGTAGGQTVFTIVIDPATGNYTFTQNLPLDHADGTDPNDLITIQFGVNATDSDGDVAGGTITIGICDDGPVAVDDGQSVGSGPFSVSGNVVTNDTVGADGATVTAVVFNGTTYTVPAGGTVTVTGTYGTLVIGSTGAYTYTSSNTAEGTDKFTYTLTDYDGDKDTAVLSVEVTDIDTQPTITPSTAQVDETNLSPVSIGGTVGADFKDDGPGTFSFSTATPGGSLAGGALTSHGVPVVMTLSGNTYTGTANGVTVFTITLNSATGAYTYTQFQALDHADGANPNDVITLQFGVNATDADGDATPTSITVSVLDDAPVAVNDTASVAPGTMSATGNVLTNDTAGHDGGAAVTKIVFNGTTYTVPAVGTVSVTGAYGTLVIGANGVFTYTSSNKAEGTDKFTYTMKDYDGDTSTAVLNLTVEDIDTTPVVTPAISQVDETTLSNSVSGTVSANFGDDGPGSFSLTNVTPGGSLAGGALTSNGAAVTVTLSGNTYTGTANGVTVFTLTLNPATGAYTFEQFKPLDHANGSNPNDVISLQFGVNAKDADGDVTPTTITINVADDGPSAANDSATVAPGTFSVGGNVTANDSVGNDKPGYIVTKVTFGNTTVDVPSTGTVTIQGAHGTLTIGANGQYTYNSSNTTTGVDQFTYQIRDFDGDTATAKLNVNVADIDTCPVAENVINKVDETALDDSGTQTVNGTLTINYGADGPGIASGTGVFTSTGSKTGGNLTSHGSAVTVTLTGDTYTGKSADGRTIFTLKINANGTYSFQLLDQLDHADKANPDDVINLNFGYKATDTDGDAATGTVTIKVHDDGPVAVDDSNTVPSAPGSVSGNILANDDAGADEPAPVKQVTFGNTTVDVPATGTVTIQGAYGTLTIGSNGQYTYTATGVGTDVFTYKIVDFDGDPATAKLTITVADLDTCPTVQNAFNKVDETALDDNGTQTVNGTLAVNYGADGPGTTSGNGAFNSTGSKTNGNLTSNGSAVTVTFAGDTYTGKSADGRTIFTLQVKADGTYTFKLLDQLDHADKTNPDDVINLNFGFIAKDTDDDSATGTITIKVHDDGPVAVDDSNTLQSAPGSVSGNVLTNDDAGADEPAPVKQITFGTTTVDVPATGTVTIQGAHGTLTIGANGQYTYTATSVGSDVFSYKIVDFDGDPSTAKLTITVNDLDTCPTVQNDCKAVDETNLDNQGTQTVNGTLTIDYKADGPGTASGTGAFQSTGSKAGGNLTSNGSAVTVTLTGDTYTGKSADGRTIFTLKINANGTYSFQLLDQLDHADKANPDDVIDLHFGFKATDTDGDAATGTITIQVHDDGPKAVDDSNSVGSAPGTATGNVLTNDDKGADQPATVKQVTFGNTTVDVPATGTITITGAHGKLTIGANGQYSYSGTSVGADVFTYKMVDSDGDPSTAKLTITVNDLDTCPTVENASNKVDETNLDDSGTQTVNGALTVNYGADGPGTTSGTGGFNSTGSKTNGNLTSNGSAVTVTFTGDTYTGKSADGRTIFTLQVKADGTYTFKLIDQLDHADKTNPDDVINLNFGFKATDTDGDVANGTITIKVHDDGPVAADDSNSVGSTPGTATGNVLTNDDAGADEPGTVKQVSFNGQTVDVPATGTVTINGAHGTLIIGANGQYTYNAISTGSDVFTYKLVDSDGDPATAKLTLTVTDIDTCPVVHSECKVVDETNLDDQGTQVVNGTLSINYGADGPGTASGTGVFMSTGSKAGGVLTSNGSAVTVAFTGDTYTGKSADGRTIFTLQVRADGTYTFKLIDQLDHADKTNPDDIIDLHFGYKATDTDGDTASSTITIEVHDDAPVAKDDSNTVTNAPATVTGNVLTNDDAGADEPAPVKQVTFGTTTVDVPATGTVTIQGAHGTLTIGANGAYSYTGTSVGADVFTYKIVDFDGDPATAKLTITVADLDTCPTVQNALNKVDETNLDNSGVQTVNGTLTVDYKADGPGKTAGDGAFSSTGSKTNGVLTSNGSAVTVTLSGDTYTGKSADGRTVFTLKVNANATYTFVLLDQLDHADKTNPDDIINLHFGFKATDADGDAANGTISIAVYDDGPVAVDDVATVNNLPGQVSGNVTSNDDVGADEPGAVKQVTFGTTTVDVPATGTVTINGAHGKLTISATGAYTYVASSNGADVFTYKLVDSDGDPTTAKLTVTVADIDTCPTVQNDCKIVDETNLDNAGTQTVTGKVVADYGADGPGTVSANGGFTSAGSKAGGVLTSNGSAVTVAFAGDTYTGKSADGRTIFTLQVKADGTYTFKLIDQLDHADKTNPDDIIDLNFGFKAVDSDGDAASGIITVQVKDDGPVAVNDVATLAEAPGTVTGNVLTNDDAGADEPGVVKQITFGTKTIDVPATGSVTIDGAYGKLTIAANGSYTYAGRAVGADVFTYKMVDFDGDPATAKLTVTVQSIDDVPTVKSVDVCVDETYLTGTGLSVTGTTQPNFFSDGPGTVKGSGASTFVAGGSLLGGKLASGGVAVVVTFDSVTNTYVGKAGTQTVFDLHVNTDGTFKFTQYANLDHANPNNPNDEITLKFGVVATDKDGDIATGTITVTVLDDAPCARDDYMTVDSCGCAEIGNVLINDTIGHDYIKNAVTSVAYKGTVYDLSATGSVTIDGANGKLTLNSDGSYVYKPFDGKIGVETFTYTITDYDHDPASANLVFSIQGSGGTVTISSTSSTSSAESTAFMMASAMPVSGDEAAHAKSAQVNDDPVSHYGVNDLLVILENAGTVTLNDFDPGEGDMIDLSSLIQDFDPVTDAINDFVFARSEGHDTVISVDPTGTGAKAAAYDVAVIKDVTGVHVEDIVSVSHQQQNQGGLGTV